MHANGILLKRLFTALGEHDHLAMASCYHPKARFRDIAFNLRGADEIYDMWRMICSGDIEVEFEVLEADDRAGRVRLVDTYTFGASKDPPKPGRRVRNAIDSRFQFEDGLIVRHEDDCDAKVWAKQAMGDGVGAFLASRIRLMRSLVANAKLTKFVRTNPE
ncbi:MAG TPA: nuclear transport factor 2 family protein [Allosphingosinicella sp.]|nr:nuclear transport factor 2 family protein [Allosphingosinicella sp.]